MTNFDLSGLYFNPNNRWEPPARSVKSSVEKILILVQDDETVGDTIRSEIINLLSLLAKEFKGLKSLKSDLAGHEQTMINERSSFQDEKDRYLRLRKLEFTWKERVAALNVMLIPMGNFMNINEVDNIKIMNQKQFDILLEKTREDYNQYLRGEK